MRIESVTLENFGLYKGTHNVQFPYDAKRHVTLIGGLNGRGKTTFLDAITLALYGKRALRYLADERIKYSQYVLNHINKSAETKQASVTINLSNVTASIQSMRVVRSWKATASSVNEELVIMHDGSIDDYMSTNWDYYVEEILPLNISRFFFFDNEKIAQIADDETFESVKDSIKSLLGLTTIDQLIDDMQKYGRATYAERKHAIDSDDVKKLKEVEQQLIDAESEMSRLIQESAGARTRLAVIQKDYAQKERDFWAKGGNLGLQKEQMIAKRSELSNKIAQGNETLLDIIASTTVPFLLCRSLVEKAFNEASQKETQNVLSHSGKLFEMLNQMLQRSELTSEAVAQTQSFLSRAQREIESISSSSQMEDGLSSTGFAMLRHLVENMSSDFARCKQVIKSIHELQDELNNVDLLLSFEASENDVKALWNEMQALTAEQLQNEILLKSHDEQQQQVSNRIAMLKNRRDQLHHSQLGAIQSQDEALRTIHYAAMTERIMEAFKKKIQSRRAKELEQRIFECFSFMMQKNSMIQRIEIDAETLDIQLIDYNGNELLKEQLSAGEKQLFAVSILWGLAQCSGYDMPVIVDTPLGRLDSNHRTNFVERYLPYASEQVIVLSTDEEINGKYWDIIKPNVNAVYTLMYDESSHSTSVAYGYFGGKSL